MRYKAFKYGEYFAGIIIAYKQKKGLFVIFKECTDIKNLEWCVNLESDSGINIGSILEFEEDVFCEIVKKKGQSYHIRFLNAVSNKSAAWITQNILLSPN